MLSPEQIEARKSGIGGSESPVIVGAAKWGSPVEIYLQKTDQAEPSIPETERMRWGNILEQTIGKEWARRTGKKYRQVKKTLRHPDHSFMVGDIDGRVLNEPAILEIKTADRFMADQWGEAGSADIPLAYYIQCQHYLFVTGLPTAYVAALIGGNEFRDYVVPADESVQAGLVAKIAEFWHCVETRTPPEPASARDAAKLYPTAGDEVAVADEETAGIITALGELKNQQKLLADQRKQLESELCGFMADRAVLVASDGSPLATWKPQSRTSIDTKRLRADHPDIAADYEKSTTFRQLRIK